MPYSLLLLLAAVIFFLVVAVRILKEYEGRCFSSGTDHWGQRARAHHPYTVSGSDGKGQPPFGGYGRCVSGCNYQGTMFR